MDSTIPVKGCHIILCLMLCHVILCYILHCLQWQGLPSCLFGLVSDCSFTPRGRNPDQIQKEKSTKINVKLVFEIFFVICRFILSRGKKTIQIVNQIFSEKIWDLFFKPYVLSPIAVFDLKMTDN